MGIQQNVSETLTLVIESVLNITTTSLPNGVQGQAYQAQLSASGGTPPYTWSATGLPAGVSLSADGLLTGTPTESGSFSVVLTCTDAG